ncbi:MAG: hypothetical protein ACPGVT_06040 [Maricaulaceae bacterium]
MFERLKLFGKAFKAVRAAQKSGLSIEEAGDKVYNDVMSEMIPGFEDIEIVDIPEDVVEYFEDDARDHIWNDKARDAFKLTQAHIDVLRQVRLGWDGCESGSSYFDPDKPFTSGETPLEMMEKAFGAASEEDQARLYVEMVWAINEFFERAEIKPGSYTVNNLSTSDIETAMTGYGGVTSNKGLGLDEDGQVVLSAEMIKVLKTPYWGWEMNGYEDDCGWPGPAIDCKRPYGDMSYWQLDMARILEWDMEKDEDGYFRTSDEQDDKLQAIHFTQLASAQAILEHGQVKL